MDILKYDELTATLALALAALYVAKRIQEPVSLVHPMLLGRQVDAGNVRKAGESAVYRNFGVGHHAHVCTLVLCPGWRLTVWFNAFRVVFPLYPCSYQRGQIRMCAPFWICYRKELLLQGHFGLLK